MRRNRFLAFGIALAVLVHCELACAAQRTFVASTGDDANACSLAAPCRTFAAAMTHTDDGGEVVVLDSAGYGTFTISQSVSIIAPAGVYAGISAFAGDYAIVVDAPGITVSLRGLHLNGFAGSLHGIRFLEGSALFVDDCVITGFGAHGISVRSSGKLIVRDTTIQDGAGTALRGEAVNAPGRSRIVLDSAQLENNLNGVVVSSNATVLVRRAGVAGNASTGVSGGATAAGDLAQVLVDRSRIVHGGTGVYSGVLVNALGATDIVLSNSTLSWNSTGWNVRNDANVALYTLGNNTVRFNGTNQAGKAEVVLAPE